MTKRPFADILLLAALCSVILAAGCAKENDASNASFPAKTNNSKQAANKIEVEPADVDENEPFAQLAPAGFCKGWSDCPSDFVCNLSSGACELRASSSNVQPVVYYLTPHTGGKGDYFIIDGQNFYQNIFAGYLTITVKVGDYEVPKDDMFVEDTRIAFKLPEGVSGAVTVINKSGFVKKTEMFLKQNPNQVYECDQTTPKASGKAGLSPIEIGPYAAGYVDDSSNLLRIYYPAKCGGLKRPGAAGIYPLIAILHEDDSMHLNYNYLGDFLATWGFVSVSIATQNPATIAKKISALLGKELKSVSSALEGVSTSGKLALIAHGHGGKRLGSVLTSDKELVKAAACAIFLAPVAVAKIDYQLPAMVVGASEDRLSRPKDYNGLYASLKKTKYRLLIRGGNHSFFTDNRVWYGFNADLDSSITRAVQFSLVSAFALPFLQRKIGLPESFPSWLENPPPAPNYLFEGEKK